MSDDIDLLAPPKKRGRPTKAMVAARNGEVYVEKPKVPRATQVLKELPDRTLFYQPVGVKFLSEVFRMEQRSILKKLRLAPGHVANERGRVVMKWDFVVAASYLIPPRIDIETYLASLNSQNIPPWLNKMFWDAQNARSKWEREAKHTWDDEAVLKVLGETAIHIREVSLLWLEGLPSRVTMSNEDYAAMQAQVHSLIDDIKERLIEQPKQRRTGSTHDRLPTLLQIDDGADAPEAEEDPDMDDLLS